MCLPHGSLSRRGFLHGALAGAASLALPLDLTALPPDPRFADRPHLQNALRAERWIRSNRVPTAQGVTWAADPADAATVRGDLYSGAAGVVLFLLELYRATGDADLLAEAVEGADHLAASSLAAPAEAGAGLYTGTAGVAFVLSEIARAAGEARHREAAARLTDGIRAAARPAGSGVEWSESGDIVSGSAGIGLFLLRWNRDHVDEAAVRTATLAGDRLLDLGIPERGGTKWALAPAVPTLYPNFSHGTAGVAYFLASLYQATGERRFLDGALAGARYLLAVGETRDGGFRVFHHEPDGEELFYLSWCHGPPGTARLFHRLGEATGDPAWTELVHACARSLLAAGVPERRSPGFWNNVSQCCGDAGVGEFFLSLHRLRPDERYVEMADRCAREILRRATEAGTGLSWVQAEHRVRPELRVAQTGLMQGAAGVGLFFARMDAMQQGWAPSVRLPDSPFA